MLIIFRIWSAIDPAQSLLDPIALLELASKGILLRSSIKEWYTTFQTQIERNPLLAQNPSTILAEIYYHAISIYLSGLFDYRPQFNQVPSPALPFGTIQSHGNCILSKTERALRTTRLAGIWFFFPLRVAGARAQSAQQKSSILIMLKEISARSFIVADAFFMDLNTLWARGMSP